MPVRRARRYAEVAALALVLLTVAAIVLATTAPLRAAVARGLTPQLALASAVACASGAFAILWKREWAWFWSLFVAVGLATGGLVQLVVGQRLGLATLACGLALAVSVVRARARFPRSRVSFHERPRGGTGDIERRARPKRPKRRKR